ERRMTRAARMARATTVLACSTVRSGKAIRRFASCATEPSSLAVPLFAACFLSPRYAMNLSAPMLANFEALPEMLTAKDLEGLLQIDRKTIYSYVQKGLIPYFRIESNVRFSKHR